MLADCAVINAGPLVALSLADRLDLLPALFGEFWIPEPVYHEVTVAGWGRPGAETLTAPDWLSRVREAPSADPLLIAELDPGEAAVISLARSLPSAMVVIDEKRGRRMARQVYDLTVKGTAGLLVEAQRRGLLRDLRTVLLDLRQKGSPVRCHYRGRLLSSHAGLVQMQALLPLLRPTQQATAVIH